MRGTLHRLAFVAAVVGALGFGGTQAFAAPGQAAEGRSCDLSQCRRDCRAMCSTCYGYCDPQLGCVCEYI